MDPNALVGLLHQAPFDGYIAHAAIVLDTVTETFGAHPWIPVVLIVLLALATAERKSDRRSSRRRRSSR